MKLAGTAYGKSFASFGEIAQGRLSNGEDFLVTLPVDLWSQCKLSYQPHATRNEIIAPLTKAEAIAGRLLERMGMLKPCSIQLEFERNIPIGQGLSSSTADMLAVIRAFQSAFKLEISQTEISELFTRIEPHDPLHFDGCVAYNHRRGQLLHAFNYIPKFDIISIDSGGELSTEYYNKHLQFSQNDMREYDLLYQSLKDAFARKDDAAIAQCAQRSAEIHAARNEHSFLSQLLERSQQWGALGLIATHSGTCAGILLNPETPAELRRNIHHSASSFGRVFETTTLSL